MTVVLDEVAPGDVDLYVDSNRDRKIDDRDRVAPPGHDQGDGGRREQRLAAAARRGDGRRDVTKTIPRALMFRLGATGRTLGYAAAGYLEGHRHDGRASRTIRPAGWTAMATA